MISDKETMTYGYYHQNVKPQPQTEGKKGYVCKICGWVYEGEPLPDDIICPPVQTWCGGFRTHCITSSGPVAKRSFATGPSI